MKLREKKLKEQEHGKKAKCKTNTSASGDLLSQLGGASEYTDCTSSEG